jgi:valyl-tRNA synthetase
MIADWPDAAALARFADEGAERSIARGQDIVLQVRALKATREVSPKAKVDLMLGDEDYARLDGDTMLDDVLKLGRVESVQRAGDTEGFTILGKIIFEGAEAQVAVLPEHGVVIDKAVESARLRKKRDDIAVELARLEKKLANEGFLAKAAPEIIEKDRARAAELSDASALLDSQIDELA